MFKPLLILKIIFLLSPGWAIASDASDDAFVPVGDTLAQTKYVDDCGGVDIDLESDMPPVDNQFQTGWCSGFATAALIDYHLHKTHPGDTYKNRISPVYLEFLAQSTIDRVNTEPVNFFNGENSPNSVYLLFEKARNSTGLYKSSDLPFDKNLTQTKYFIADNLLPNSSKINLSPTFNMRSFVTTHGDSYVEEIKMNLLRKSPMVAAICSDQLYVTVNQVLREKQYQLSDEIKHQCGAHDLAIIGLKKREGQCWIHLRNSWGANWPETDPQANGNIWLPLKNYMQILAVNRDIQASELISISSRNREGIMADQIAWDTDDNPTTFTGRTMLVLSNVLLYKEGTLAFKNGSIAKGNFEFNKLVDGTYKGLLIPQKEIYYDGPIINGKVTDDGKLYDLHGLILPHSVLSNSNYKVGS